MPTPRERFALTLQHRDVDRPPMDLGQTDMTGVLGGLGRLAPALGLGEPLAADTPAGQRQEEAILRALAIDIRCVGGILVPRNSPLERRISDTEFSDVWGIVQRWNGHHYEAVGRPLADATIDDLEKYPWPRAEDIDPAVVRAAADRARQLREETDFVVCARHPYFGVFELGCWMCGFDDFLYRLAGEPEFVQRFFAIFHAYQKQVDELYYGALGRYVHYTTSGDDFGTQRALFLSPDMFREQVLPWYRSRIRNFHSYSDGAFFHHSCGAVRPIIRDLMDAGMDILNPVQPGAEGMEPEGLKRDFGAELTFYGGLDTQHLLPRGTPDEVRAGARTLVATLGASGGYVFSAAHSIQEDVPAENVVAMYREAGRRD